MKWRRPWHRLWRGTAMACKPTARGMTRRAGVRLGATNPARAARARNTSTATADLAEAADPRRRRLSVAELPKSQLLSESTIALEMPFATRLVVLLCGALLIRITR